MPTGAGRIRFTDIVEDVTLRDEFDETTGMTARVIVEQRDRSLSPQLEVVSPKEGTRSFIIPVGARLLVGDGDEVPAGTVLVKIPRERTKTRDITGGLPRVAELFEARRPQGARGDFRESTVLFHLAAWCVEIARCWVTSPEGEETQVSVAVRQTPCGCRREIISRPRAAV